MQLTEEQLKMRAHGEEMNQRVRDSFKPKEPSAQDIIDVLPNQNNIEYAFGEKIIFNKKNKIIFIKRDDRPLWKRFFSDIFRRDIK